MSRRMRPKAWVRRFETSCREWQVKLGLTDWTFRFETVKGDGTYVATVDMDAETREAKFKAFKYAKHDDPPERIGLHETLHVLFVEMLETAARRGDAAHVDVAREEHRAIERLVNYMEGTA